MSAPNIGGDDDAVPWDVLSVMLLLRFYLVKMEGMAV